MSSKNAWARLGHRQKMAVCTRVAKRERSSLRKLNGVLEVGWGIKEIAREITEAPCIKVYVKKKWVSNHKSASSIPPYFLSYAKYGTQHLRVEVPTDVVVIGTPKPEAAANGVFTKTQYFSNYEDATSGLMLKAKRQSDHRRWILGCAHAFAAVKKGGGKPRAPQYSQYITEIANESLRLTHISNLNRVDAALIEVPSHSNLVPKLPDGRTITGIGDSSILPFRYKIYTKRGAVDAICSGILPTVRYPIAGPKIYRNVILSLAALDSTKPTIEGDSGAPLVDSSGKVIGIHFAGDHYFSYAMPIDSVLSGFSIGLRVITG